MRDESTIRHCEERRRSGPEESREAIPGSSATLWGLLRRAKALLAMTFVLSLSGCYSFTGSSIPPHIHTIGIPMAEDNSGFGQSDLRQNLTDLLVQKFTNEGSLRVASRSNADALLEVSIPGNGVTDMPVSVKTGEIVTAKKVTISVHAIYRDQKKQKVFWERDFNKSAQYEIAQGQAGMKTALHNAEDQLAEDLLIAAISNW
jgi:hypothetical protein